MIVSSIDSVPFPSEL